MKNRNRIFAIISPFIFILALVGGILIGSKFNNHGKLSPGKEKFDGILELISDQYVDEIDVDSLLEMSIPDLLSYLDPHSAYIPASDFEDVNSELEGSFSGVGISFQILSDSVTVAEVIPGGPAEKVGIQAGDRIVMADNKNLTGSDVTSETVFKTLRGEKNTTVVLKVKRSGVKDLITYDVVRGDIPVNSVDSKYLIEPNIGYVRISKFAKNTYQEYLEALAELTKQGANKVILDLRGNSGGFMEQAIFMANELLPEGKTIVYTKGRDKDSNVFATSDGNGLFQDTQIVVLTDEYSASASEIFAGAVQDNDRGLIIGRRSFGKGLVQNQIMLPDNSAVRLTVARYYTPSGRSIQKEYQRGSNGKYDMDILDRYNHGEFYSADSIKLDKTKKYRTVAGRTVYGGGGIMPDIFVPDDTIGYTSYYINVMNKGLIPKYAMQVADNYRKVLKDVKTLNKLLTLIPRDQILLNNFVDYAVKYGVPARWYYINQSRDLILRQIKAVLARDILGYDAYFQMINRNDPVVLRAVKELKMGNSPIHIKK
jgi:carboxyl-terminal processing protease